MSDLTIDECLDYIQSQDLWLDVIVDHERQITADCDCKKIGEQ